MNTYRNTKGIEFILVSNVFNHFRERLKSFIQEDNEIDDKKKGYIMDNIPGLRRYPVRKRIDDYFVAYNIKYDKEEIGKLKEIRDTITHSGKLPKSMNVRTVVDYERKLRVLIQRTYLTLLGCTFTYSIDNLGFMHPKLSQKEA